MANVNRPPIRSPKHESVPVYVPDIPLAATPVAVMSVVDPFRVTEHVGEFATLPSGILMANLNVDPNTVPVSVPDV